MSTPDTNNEAGNKPLRTFDAAAVRIQTDRVAIGFEDPEKGPLPGERYIDERGEVQLFDPEMPEPYEDQLKAAEAKGEADRKAERAALIKERAKKVVDADIAAKRAKAVEAGKEFKEPLEAEVAAMMVKEVIRQEDKYEKEAEKAKEEKEAKSEAADQAMIAARRVNRQVWAQNLGWIRSSDKIVKLGDARKQYTVQGFNTIHAGQVPQGANTTPFAMVRDGNGFTEIAAAVYAAGLPPVYEYEGEMYANLYSEASLPVAAKEYTEEGREAVAMVLRHLGHLFGDDERTVRMVESWIALNVRFPGKLLCVGLVVKGIEGDGKTVIFQGMMSALMGSENVADISQQEMRSDFNAWASGRALRVVEELKMAGKNRHELLNQIKTLITNEFISVIRKNVDGVKSLNTTNYCGMTNFTDALPLGDTDRRWWVLFTQFQTVADIARIYGDARAYFDKLRAVIKDHAAELKKYFMECDIHPEVYHGMRSPQTAGRTAMIAEEGDSLGAGYLDHFLEEGAWGVCKNVVAGAALTDHLANAMGKSEAPKSKQLLRLLTSRGFVRYPKMVKWKGHPYTMYVVPAFAAYSDENNVTIREYLDKTAEDEAGRAVSPPTRHGGEHPF